MLVNWHKDSSQFWDAHTSPAAKWQSFSQLRQHGTTTPPSVEKKMEILKKLWLDKINLLRKAAWCHQKLLYRVRMDLVVRLFSLLLFPKWRVNKFWTPIFWSTDDYSRGKKSQRDVLKSRKKEATHALTSCTAEDHSGCDSQLYQFVDGPPARSDFQLLCTNMDTGCSCVRRCKSQPGSGVDTCTRF